MSDEAEALFAQLQGGDKIGAIKRIRELTGASLIEARDAIERIRSVTDARSALQGVRSPPQPRIGNATGVDLEVRKLAADGQRIAAIKLLRERTGLGLKEAKDLLDQTVPPPPHSYRGWWIFWGLFAVVMVGAAAFVLLQAP